MPSVCCPAFLRRREGKCGRTGRSSPWLSKWLWVEGGLSLPGMPREEPSVEGRGADDVWLVLSEFVCLLMLHRPVFLHTCTHACTDAHIHTHTHTYTLYANIHTHTHTYTHMQTYTHTHTCTHACVRAYMRVCVHMYTLFQKIVSKVATNISVCVCIHVCVCVCAHVYTCMLYANTTEQDHRTEQTANKEKLPSFFYMATVHCGFGPTALQ